jgi:phage tail-like protein
MRGQLDGLASPHPLGSTLPGLYADDRFAQRLCQGLDEVLAPVLATLDCLPAYFDPGTAPRDLLEWLAGWVGLAAATDVPDSRRRQLIAAAARLWALRGTPFAIKTIVELTTGYTPEIEESGRTHWSQEPETSWPATPVPELVVRLRTADPHVEEPQLTALITAFAPAHIPWRLELLRDDGLGGAM